jgi:hypothetical protein
MQVVTAGLAVYLSAAATLAAAVTANAAETAASEGRSNLTCFSPRDIESTKPISDREIVFRMRNGKVWKNTLRTDCPGLKFEGGFSWTIRGDTVCENLQTIRVLRRGNACLLGKFTLYTPPASN